MEDKPKKERKRKSIVKEGVLYLREDLTLEQALEEILKTGVNTVGLFKEEGKPKKKRKDNKKGD